MSTTTDPVADRVAAANAAGAVAAAQAAARDAADAALADAVMSGNVALDGGEAAPDAPALPNTPLTNTPQTPAATPPARRDLTRIGGDATGDLITDDFGLDGDLRSVMERSLEAAFADDLAKDDKPTTSADTAATPDPAQPSPDAPVAPGGDGAGVGGAADSGPAPGSPAAPAPGTPAPLAAADDQFSLDQYARDYFGTNLDRDTAQHLFGILGRFQQGTPEQRQAIDAILAGRQPQTIPQLPADAPMPGGGAAEVAIPGLPPRPPDTDYEGQQLYDRYIAPLAQAQAAQVAALRADIERTTAQQLDTQRTQQAALIDSAAATWRQAHPVLTDGEFDALTQRATQAGTFPALIAAHHGNVEAATAAIYDQHFWSDPTFRERAHANAASGRDPITGAPDAGSVVAADQQQLEAGRRALAASVAGGGGHAPVRTPAPPRTAAERKTALVGEIAAHMGGVTE